MIVNPTHTAYAHKKILVIDDERRLAESLAALLRGDGYNVDAASTGPAGLERIREETYDLIITDLRMDSVDGFDIMRHAAEVSPTSDIIVITAHASTESAIEALHQRVADYIPKPFDFEILRRSIERVFVKQEADRLRDDMLHMLTHDIKAPLTSVLGFAQLIVKEDGELHDKTPHFAEIIVSNSQRILGMLDNYLTNARVEEGRLEVLPIEVDPLVVIEEELRLNSLEITRKRVSLEKSLERFSGTIRADEHLFARAIGNLIGNAAKYVSDEGVIRITLDTDDRHTHFTISNTGKQISKEETKRIFDRYERLSSSEGIRGTGLGLHVVKCVAEAHNGSVHCDCIDGITSFRFSLPR